MSQKWNPDGKSNHTGFNIRSPLKFHRFPFPDVAPLIFYIYSSCRQLFNGNQRCSPTLSAHAADAHKFALKRIYFPEFSFSTCTSQKKTNRNVENKSHSRPFCIFLSWRSYISASYVQLFMSFFIYGFENFLYEDASSFSHFLLQFSWASRKFSAILVD